MLEIPDPPLWVGLQRKKRKPYVGKCCYRTITKHGAHISTSYACGESAPHKVEPRKYVCDQHLKSLKKEPGF